MAPAIARASEGHALSWLDIGYIAASAPVLARDPASASIFLADGGVPAPAIQHRIEPVPRLVQTDLASSLALIAREGVDVFCRGKLGERVVTHLSAQGGWLAPEDLARYRAREAIVTEIGYRGFRIATGSDTEVLEALLILERFDLRALGHNSAAALHIIAEACRLAHADFYRYMTAPEGGPPAAAALEKAHIRCARRADPSRWRDRSAPCFPTRRMVRLPGGLHRPRPATSPPTPPATSPLRCRPHGHVFGSGRHGARHRNAAQRPDDGLQPEARHPGVGGAGPGTRYLGLAGSRDNPRRRVFRLRRAGGKTGCCAH